MYSIIVCDIIYVLIIIKYVSIIWNAVIYQ